MTDTMANTPSKPHQHSSHWSGVFAMAVCAFALVASEFLPVSLLTPLAQDLHVSEGMAGQGIAISGAFAVLTSLFISALSGSLDRKTLLLGLTIIMGISGAIVALAPNYSIYMLGRSLIGVVVGGFWSMSAATAIRLVPPHDVPRALAIINGGNALATVIAAPLGAWLGTFIGWRGTFWLLVPISLFSFFWQWKALPFLPAAVRISGIGSVLKPFTLFSRPIVTIGMLACAMLFMGQFGLFTYVRPFLERVTHVQETAISLILLVIGVSGFIGTVLIGRILQKSFYQTLVIIPLLMAATALGLIIFGDGLIIVVMLLALWGLTGTAAPVGWWAWLARTFPKDAEAGGGLLVAVVQTSIALGSTIGGLLFDYSGHHTTFMASAILLLLCAVFTSITARKSTVQTEA